MAFLAPLAPALAAIGSVAGIAGTAYSILKKPPAAPAVIPPVTRDDATAAAQVDDQFRRRQGSLADILTGSNSTTGPYGMTNTGTAGRFIAGN